MPFSNRFFRKSTAVATHEDWKAWQLSTYFTTSLFLIEVGIVILIIVLERVSSRNNGLTTVSELPTDPVRNEPFSNIIWSYGLLWTAFPALLMAVYRLGWDAIVSASAERQPYIDLNRRSETDAQTVDRTIMLDYRHYPFIYNWLVAFKMKHIIIGCAMFLSSVLSIVLVPLTSHLFVAMVSVSEASFNATFPNTFNSAQLINLDLQPALSLARSTLVYNAESPPWATTKFSFEPFELPQIDDPRNYTIPVQAYYGQLDCELLQVPAPEISFGSPQSIDSFNISQNTLSYQAFDRGCRLPKLDMYLSEVNPKTIARTWGTVSCGDEAHISRIGMLSGNPTSSTSVANVSITSCIPSYWKTTGSLTISARKNLPPKVESFVEHTDDESEFRPTGARVLEVDLTLYAQSDAKGILRSDVLSIIVYEVAKNSSPDSPYDPVAIKTALGTVWPSVFTYLTTTSLIQDPQPHTVVGQQMRAENRLFVYPPVAWIIVAIMLSVAICNAFLIYTAETSQSILQEEPVGLLGAAALLHDSQVTSFVAENRYKLSPGLTFRETIQKKYTVSDSKCWYDEQAKIIRLSRLQWPRTDNTAEEGMSGSASSTTQPVTTPSAPVNEPSAPQVDAAIRPSATLNAPSAAPSDAGIELQPLPAQNTAETRPPVNSDISEGLSDHHSLRDSVPALSVRVPPTIQGSNVSISGAVPDQSSHRDSVSALSDRVLPTVEGSHVSLPEHIAETQPAPINLIPQQRVSHPTW